MATTFRFFSGTYRNRRTAGFRDNPGEIIAHHAGSGIIYEALVAPQSVAAGTAFVTITTADGNPNICRMQQDADWDAGVEYKYGINIE